MASTQLLHEEVSKKFPDSERSTSVSASILLRFIVPACVSIEGVFDAIELHFKVLHWKKRKCVLCFCLWKTHNRGTPFASLSWESVTPPPNPFFNWWFVDIPLVAGARWHLPHSHSDACRARTHMHMNTKIHSHTNAHAHAHVHAHDLLLQSLTFPSARFSSRRQNRCVGAKKVALSRESIATAARSCGATTLSRP